MIFTKIPAEAMIWLVALLIVASIDPGQEIHFTLCPLSNLGFDHCPGCGLGRAVSLAFHGQVQASFHTHPLGLLTILILSFRIIQLIKTTTRKK